MKYIVILVPIFNLFLINVDASSYSSNTNLSENSYSNTLIDMGNSQITNFLNKKFVIFQYDYDYYLVSSDNYSLNNNVISMDNTSIIKASRYQSGYNYYYDYSISNENNTLINVSNLVISNIPVNKAISSKRFADYNHYLTIKNIGIFILGLCFALFLTKERSYL